MKKKLFAVISMVLILLVAGSIYFKGSKSHVSASQEISIHSMREFGMNEIESTTAFQLQTRVLDEVTEGPPKDNKTTTPQTNNDNSNEDKEPNDLIPSSQEVQKESEDPADNQEATLPAEPEDSIVEEEQSEDFIMINDQKYYNIMHEEKFSHRINVSLKYGAKLYAIPYSDGFAIVKDGVPIVHLTSGIVTAKPSNTDILCDLFSDRGEYATDIAEGIKHVAQTGETVKVGVTPESTAFTILKRDEWIVVYWQ